MSNILEILHSQLDANQVKAISQKLGASPDQTQAAIQAALPTLLGALGRQTQTEEGARQIHDAVSGRDRSLTESLGRLLNMSTGNRNAGNNSAMEDDLLGQLLGSKRGRVQDAIGKSSGIGESQVGALLAMLAPMLLSVVGKQQQSKGLNPTDLAGMLRQENDSIEKAGGGFLGRLLDQDGDGDFDLSDALTFGMEKLMGRR